jgi:hypothetical protein
MLARDSEHIAVGAEDDLGLGGDRNGSVDRRRSHALEELAIAFNLKFFLIPAVGAERKIKLWEIQISVRSTPGGL